MLLDLKMPWMDGFDVLSWLRRQPQLRALPVVVLTSSRLRSDVERSRLMGVYDYRVKPHDLAELVSLLVDIRKCWLNEGADHFLGAGRDQECSNSSNSGELSEPPDL
jgi:CheY-like chemotaxis protein